MVVYIFFVNKSKKTKPNYELTLTCIPCGHSFIYLTLLCHKAPLLCGTNTKNILMSHTVDRVTYSFITADIGTVVYLESIPHTPFCCCK